MCLQIQGSGEHNLGSRILFEFSLLRLLPIASWVFGNSVEPHKSGVAKKNYWVLVSVFTLNHLTLSKRAGDTFAIHRKWVLEILQSKVS